jgi:hypothetical protein
VNAAVIAFLDEMGMLLEGILVTMLQDEITSGMQQIQ